MRISSQKSVLFFVVIQMLGETNPSLLTNPVNSSRPSEDGDSSFQNHGGWSVPLYSDLSWMYQGCRMQLCLTTTALFCPFSWSLQL